MENYNQELSHSGVNGERLAARLDELSKIGKLDSGGVNRPGYSLEEKQAKEMVIGWMKEAGLAVSIDGAGNVFGELNGCKQGRAVGSGSHLDSVPNGGNFDGPLGVLAALEVVEAWKEQNYVPAKPFVMAIFSDEEGSRFKSGLTGSRAFMGQITKEELDSLVDEDGKTFAEVITAFGSSVEQYLHAASQKGKIGTFVEVHIEQGKVLERAGEPVGIVSGIAGPAWVELTFIGEAGHAGNTPMMGRKDPLVAAGMFIQAIEKLPEQVSGTAVATVGKINVVPNGVNVIPGRVDLVVDIRDIYEPARDQLVDLIIEKAKNISTGRQIEVEIKINTRIKPVPIAEDFQNRISKAFSKYDIKPNFIPSGAGHDSMILGTEIPVAMLFVRSKDGISHNPREWTSLNDCVYAVHVLKEVLEDLIETEN
ncbi:allantoate amidohydrolase [Bacillus rubiinfantis]|uniref:allantoate amidohydrolase n=1 Tax=Bacillus rubiinfantis TaxID=1499680 RepID=UPI00165287B3